MISLEHPVFLIFFLFIPLGIYLRYYWRKRGGRITFSIGVGPTRKTLFKPHQKDVQIFWFLGEVFYWLTLLCVVMSLTGITYIKSKRVYLNRGTDIIFVLDESPSMSAKDYSGNRFETACRVIGEFIESRENDSVGLVSVGEQAVLRIPLTMDYRFFNERLASLQVGTLGNGTALGRGISLAAVHLKDSPAAQKTIILLTDGENTDTLISPFAAVEAIEELGIRLYTVGIGTLGNVEFEYFNPEERKIVTGILESRCDDELLKALAEKTGGKFYSAASVRSLSDALKRIESLELTSKSVKIERELTNLSHFLNIVAIFCFLISFFIKKSILKELL